MKLLLAIFVTALTTVTPIVNAYTESELKERAIIQLLSLYYGDIESNQGLSLLYGKGIQGAEVRKELESRENLTDQMMQEFRQSTGNTIILLYSLLALAEFGNPSQSDHDFVMSKIKAVWAKVPEYRSTGIPVATYDGMILMGMGAYLAGQPSAEGEPILLEMLRRGEIDFGVPFTLRMVEKHPTAARLNALRNRNYGTKVLNVYQTRTKEWVNDSIPRIEARLQEAEGARAAAAPSGDPLKTSVMDIATPAAPKAMSVGDHTVRASDMRHSRPWLWFVGITVVIVSITILRRQRQRRP